MPFDAVAQFEGKLRSVLAPCPPRGKLGDDRVTAACDKLPGVGEPARHGGNQIALDRKDHVGGADIEDALDRPAERTLRRGKLVVAMQRLPLIPAALSG
jgi:hypothetical protein